ncbi:MAG: hypothetical protein R8J85_03835 [Mariprofundales bacterium]
MTKQPIKSQYTKDPQCMRCQHFHVTWEPEKPYGCRSFGFKSKRLPSLEVKMASGEQCLRFENKRR